MTKPLPFIENAIQRAVNGARKAGLRNSRVEAQADGTIVIWPNHPNSTPILTVPEALGSVYVIGFNVYVKIGFSRNLQQRLSSLQTGMPEKLMIYAAIPNVVAAEEVRLHKRFSSYRLEGEWFRKEDELAVWIEAGCPL